MNVQLIESMIKHLTFGELDTFSKFIIVFEKRKIKGAMQNLVFDFCFNSISLKNGTMITAENVTISNGEMAFYVSDLSKINLYRIKLENLKLGFKAEKKSDVFGP